MKKLSKMLLLVSVFFLLTLIYINLYANDSSGAILPTGDVQLRKTNGIILEVESLYIKPKITSHMEAIIEVNYIFKNITDKDIVTEVFFPLIKTEVHNWQMSYEHNFNFKLYVNGKEKEYNTHSERGVYFYWQQTFPANKRIHIKHVYTAHGYSNAGGLLYMLNEETNGRVEASEEYLKHKTRDYARASGLFGYILTTANNWNKPIRSFNLLVECFAGADIYFEGKLYPSLDRCYAKNIINFSPSSELFFMFNQKVIYKNDLPDWDVMKECRKNIKFSDAKLYKVYGTANIRNNPNGKKIGKIKDGEYVWVVESAQDWSKIAHNDLRGWTHKQNLIDIWTADK